MISLNTPKDRTELERQVAEFKAKGGKIKVYGVTRSGYEPVYQTEQSANLGKVRKHRGPGITITPGSRHGQR